jgi:Gram-negative bacterial TonB protein C-terminal
VNLVRPAGAQKYLADTHKSGIVDIKVYLAPDGSVAKAVIVRSSGDVFLDGATYDAAVATTYAAEIQDCEAVSGGYIYRTRYNAEATPDPSPPATPSPAPAAS